MNRSTNRPRANPGRSRREALGLLGAGGRLARHAALRAAGDDDEKVLTEALVLRDPEIPVGRKSRWRHHHRRIFRLQLPVLPQGRTRAAAGGAGRRQGQAGLKDWPILGDGLDDRGADGAGEQIPGQIRAGP